MTSANLPAATTLSVMYIIRNLRSHSVLRAGWRQILLGPVRPCCCSSDSGMASKNSKSFESNILNGGIPRTESPIHHCFHASRTPMRGSANLLEHGGIDHQNNANDILALFLCVVHRHPLYFQRLHQHGAIVYEYLLKIHQKFVVVSVLSDSHRKGHTLQLLS